MQDITLFANNIVQCASLLDKEYVLSSFTFWAPKDVIDGQSMHFDNIFRTVCSFPLRELCLDGVPYLINGVPHFLPRFVHLLSLRRFSWANAHIETDDAKMLMGKLHGHTTLEELVLRCNRIRHLHKVIENLQMPALLKLDLSQNKFFFREMHTLMTYGSQINAFPSLKVLDMSRCPNFFKPIADANATTDYMRYIRDLMLTCLKSKMALQLQELRLVGYPEIVAGNFREMSDVLCFVE